VSAVRSQRVYGIRIIPDQAMKSDEIPDTTVLKPFNNYVLIPYHCSLFSIIKFYRIQGGIYFIMF
jgi:hypothetical protein